MALSRRSLFLLLPALAQLPASLLAAAAAHATGGPGDPPAPLPEAKGHDVAQRTVIVNADDFGESVGVNRGIIEAHERGVVTSASLMVGRPGTVAAVALARQRPDLSLGLHVNLDGIGLALIGQERLDVLGREIERQFKMFTDLTGSLPTHLDSHHHVHRQLNVARLFLTLSQRHGIPLRGFSDVVYLGGFYAQWDFGKFDRRHISVEYLITLFGKAAPGFTEIGCHPGYTDFVADAAYSWQREVELNTLTDPRAKASLLALGIRLVNYRDYGSTVGVTAAQASVPGCQSTMTR
ncbi:MAG TPA: ChbG/HpnK family deacetylase [Methylomirabilota bacterium]|nr:ChbG/HpnK family deacetylase [Methylomirabilota bacterium]